MPFDPAPLAGITRLWQSHANQYRPAIFGLILCGANHPADGLLYSYVRSHSIQLDDMAGPYTSLTIIVSEANVAIAGNAGPLEIEEERTDIEYLHATSSWALNAEGAYRIAHALGLRLDGMPFIVLSGHPTTSNGFWALSVRDAVRPPDEPDSDVDESGHGAAAAAQIARLFEVLLTQGREAYDQTAENRLKIVRKAVEREFRKRSGWSFSQIAESGVIAQIIEGITKGLR